MQVAVPAGRYVVSAMVMSGNSGTVDTTSSCSVSAAGATGSDFVVTPSPVGYTRHVLGTTMIIPGATTIRLECGDGALFWSHRRVIATRVAEVTRTFLTSG